MQISIRGFTRNQDYRWQAIDQMRYRKKQGKTKKKFESYVLTNGDTKQLLARSRYFLYKTNQSGLKTKQNDRIII
jgi:hypothetical protein